MRRTIIFTTIALMFMGGLALADRGRGHRGGGRVVVRDHRGGHHSSVRVKSSRHRQVHRGHHRSHVHRGPIRVSNGRYVFGNGVTRVYRRPVIRERYYNYRVRPRIIVESYDPVPGYVWVGGSWQWNGGEWIWYPGHYVVDPNVSFSAGVTVGF